MLYARWASPGNAAARGRELEFSARELLQRL